MAKPKFPLRMDDGSEVRTLEELREHADFATIAGRYDDGALRRWLRTWDFVAETEKVEQLDNEAEGFHKALYEVLGIPWTEETDAQVIQYTDAEIERELAAQHAREKEEEQLQEDVYEDIDEEKTEEIMDGIAQTIIEEANERVRMSFPLFVRYVETENYVLCEGGFCKPKLRIEKKTGLKKEIEIDNKIYGCSKAGDMLYALDYRSHDLVSLNLETMEEKVLMENVCPWHISTQHFDFAPIASSKMIGYAKSSEVFLFNCETSEEVNIIQGGTGMGIPNFASHDQANMALTENALYFLYGGHSGHNVVGGLYRYDIRTRERTLLLSQEDIERTWGDYQYTNGITAVIAKGDTMLITNICSEDYIRKGYTQSNRNPYWAKLVLNTDGTAVKIEKTQRIEPNAYCGIAYEDGFLYITERKNHDLYLSFVNVDGDEKSFPLWTAKDAEQSEKFTKNAHNGGLRLGNYFYYPFYGDDKKIKEIWKISLETGEQVQLPCEN